MPEATRRFTFDTVVLSNFALADALWLLSKRYAGRLMITTEVMDELEAGVAGGHGNLEGVARLVQEGHFSIVSLTRDERVEYRHLLSSLSEGEASCIAVAVGRDATVATDDLRARTICQERRLRLTGSVGILKAAHLAGDITLGEGEQMLSDMVTAGFFSPVPRLADIL